MKQKITALYINDKDRNGTPFVSKEGRPYKKLAIKTELYGDRYLSGFCSRWNDKWAIGDMVEEGIDFEIEKTIGRDGKEYLNLKQPDPLKRVIARVEALEQRLNTMQKSDDKNWGTLHSPNANLDETFSPQPDPLEDLPF